MHSKVNRIFSTGVKPISLPWEKKPYHQMIGSHTHVTHIIPREKKPYVIKLYSKHSAPIVSSSLDLFGLWFYVTGNSILSCREEFLICANVEIICALLHALALCQNR